MGHSWGLLGIPGVLLGVSGALLGALGACSVRSWGYPGAILCAVRVLLEGHGRSWVLLGRSLGGLGRSRGALGALWGTLGSCLGAGFAVQEILAGQWAHWGASLAHSWVLLGRPGSDFAWFGVVYREVLWVCWGWPGRARGFGANTAILGNVEKT